MSNMLFRTLLEGCSFKCGKVYQDGVSLDVAIRSGGFQTGAGGAGGEATDQTAWQSTERSAVLQVCIMCSSDLSLSICSNMIVSFLLGIP